MEEAEQLGGGIGRVSVGGGGRARGIAPRSALAGTITGMGLVLVWLRSVGGRILNMATAFLTKSAHAWRCSLFNTAIQHTLRFLQGRQA